MSEKVQKKTTLSAKQNKAIAALLEGASKQDAALLAGVNVKTISRWIADDDNFSHELRRRSDLIVHDATRRMIGTLDMSADIFREVMQDDTVHPAVRLRAADLASRNAIRLLETSELLQRIEALEARL